MLGQEMLLTISNFRIAYLEQLMIFDNDFARNIIIFGVYNNSSSHSDNRKNNFFNIR